jgi:hypothetical protein
LDHPSNVVLAVLSLPFLLADGRLEFLDAVENGGRAVLVRRVSQDALCPTPPIIAPVVLLHGPDGLPLGAFQRSAVSAFAVVADQDGLAQRDALNGVPAGLGGFLCSLAGVGAVPGEPPGPVLGPVGQRGVLVLDLAAQFQSEVFPARGPNGKKAALFVRPTVAGFFEPVE